MNGPWLECRRGVLDSSQERHVFVELPDTGAVHIVILEDQLSLGELYAFQGSHVCEGVGRVPFLPHQRSLGPGVGSIEPDVLVVI